MSKQQISDAFTNLFPPASPRHHLQHAALTASPAGRASAEKRVPEMWGLPQALGMNQGLPMIYINDYQMIYIPNQADYQSTLVVNYPPLVMDITKPVVNDILTVAICPFANHPMV